MLGADFVGALIRWTIRRFKTDFKDELVCEEGWFRNIPIIKKIPLIDEWENTIIAQLFVVIVFAILFVIGVL